MGEGVALGRYTLHKELASGGMASVFIGRLNGPVGFSRTVAIKRLHAPYAKDLEFVKMFLDEARLAARIQHPNVVSTLDVVARDGELFVVLDFVQGESLAALARAVSLQGTKIPTPIVTALLVGALNGLEAAHEARDERGESLGIVHRDVSPQNILVGADGITRLLDFGVAKANARLSSTQDGRLKGKIPYMAPEQLEGAVSRQTDIYSVGVVLWELLAGRPLFRGETELQTIALVQRGLAAPPSEFNLDVPPSLDRICQKALARSPEERYATAREMALDIDRSVETASAMRVSAWMTSVAGAVLDARAKLVADVESGLTDMKPPDVLSELEATTTPPSSPSPRDAATQVFATVSSVARAADQAVREAATKVATKAARDVAALGGSALVTKSEETAQRVLRAFAPLVRSAKTMVAVDAKKRPAAPTEEPTRSDVREPAKLREKKSEE
ncbi:MAG: serine/threonine protein kinase [Labilithrix sp.]|nr:serine/threonine protein kinase [Labilithrix sp.]